MHTHPTGSTPVSHNIASALRRQGPSLAIHSLRTSRNTFWISGRRLSHFFKFTVTNMGVVRPSADVIVTEVMTSPCLQVLGLSSRHTGQVQSFQQRKTSPRVGVPTGPEVRRCRM
jgi:hypothetical protein